MSANHAAPVVGNPPVVDVPHSNSSTRKSYQCNPRACKNPGHRPHIRVWKGFKGEWYWQLRDPHNRAIKKPIGGKARSERGAKTVGNRALRCYAKGKLNPVAVKPAVRPPSPNQRAKTNPRRRKVVMSLKEFARRIKASGDKALWAKFMKMVDGYRKWTHGSLPKKVVLEAMDVPGMSGTWIQYEAGRSPEALYVMPKGSKRKGAWRHPWKRMPSVRHDPQAGVILQKLASGNRVTDFYHG